jgi:hypothetical protein
MVERSIYSLPKTPKVIILNDQEGELFVLVQEFEYSIEKYLQKIILPTDLLEFVDKTLKAYQCLSRRYGPFHVAESMMGLNKNMEVMTWINSIRYKNEPEAPPENSGFSEKEMIAEIMNIIRSHVRKEFHTVIPKYLGHSFEEFSHFVGREIERRKIQLASLTLPAHKVEQRTFHVMSPQNSFGSVKPRLAKHESAKDNSIKAERKTVVPKFLQKNKERNLAFLDSIHRRTKTF